MFDFFNFHMWPNLAILDYHHIDYITKSLKETFMEHFIFKIITGLKFEHKLLLHWWDLFVTMGRFTIFICFHILKNNHQWQCVIVNYELVYLMIVFHGPFFNFNYCWFWTKVSTPFIEKIKLVNKCLVQVLAHE